MYQALAVLFVASLGATADNGAVAIGPTKHLFLDDYLVASKQNVTRTVHPAAKCPANPVLQPTEDSDGTVAIVYGSVIRDRDKYRMWYHSGAGVSYAESRDGITWTKPGLGTVKVDGEDTNVVIDREAEEGQPNVLPFFYEIFGVHQNPNAEPEQRYVMGYLSIQRDYSGPREDVFHRGQRRGLGVATSPDGLHWSLAESWTTEAICDGATHWMWDPAREAYVLYGRTKYVSPEVKAAWVGDEWVDNKFWGRSVARVQSPDFINWDFKDPATAPVVMTVDTQDVPGDEIYSMLVFPYESVYVGLVQMFHNQADTCNLDIQLAVSHDGVEFTRVGDRTPFIPCGGPGAWDRFNNSLANNPPIEVGDDLRFYYGGRTYRHSPYDGPDKGESWGGIGLATIKRDRFVSLDASFDGGVIETVPVKLASAKLHINAECAFGEIIVEAIRKKDNEDTVVDVSKPIKGDGLDLLVEWTEPGFDAAEGPVVLRITLKNARLYALWCE